MSVFPGEWPGWFLKGLKENKMTMREGQELVFVPMTSPDGLFVSVPSGIVKTLTALGWMKL